MDALHAELDAAGVLHPTAGGLTVTDFGTREFAAVDRDGNLLVFYRWQAAQPGSVVSRGADERNRSRDAGFGATAGVTLAASPASTISD